MNKDFSKVTSQVAASYLLQDKWCTEYTSSHYNADELNLLCLNIDSEIMVPRYEFMRFFRVVPDQATGMTKRDIVRAYVVNASTAINDLHLELEYTEDSKYDMALDIFCRKRSTGSNAYASGSYHRSIPGDRIDTDGCIL